MTETPKERLRLLTRAAIIRVKGDTDKAIEALNADITAANSVILERELCKDWRIVSIRALLSTHFNELRAEGKIKKPDTHHIDTTDYSRTTERPKTWASQHVEEAKERRRNYLETYLIDGQPLGDCTTEVVLNRADKFDQEADFLRRVVNGIPVNGKVRDFISPDQAEDCWKASTERKLFEAPKDPVWQTVWPWLMKGIKTKEDFTVVQDMVNQVIALEPKPNTPQSVLLDALANIVKEYEDKFLL